MASKLSTDKIPMSRLRNSLVKAINERDKLPKLIIVLLDNEWLGYVDIIDRSLKWFIAKLDRYIRTRKEMLPSRCLKDDQPYFIIVKQTPIRNWLDPARIYRDDWRDINTALESTLANYHNFLAINLNAILPTDDAYFTARADLTARGQSVYWDYLNTKIRDLEANNMKDPSRRKRYRPRGYRQ